MEPWFGVIAGGMGTATKEDAFGDFNPRSNAPIRPQHSNLNTKWHVQKREIKKVLDLSKLTLFGTSTLLFSSILLFSFLH